mgnify:CR=1 FL=1
MLEPLQHRLLVHRQYLPHDITGTEFMHYRKELNQRLAHHKSILTQYEISCYDVESQTIYAGISNDEEIRVYLRFNTVEDYTLAKLVLGDEIVKQDY